MPDNIIRIAVFGITGAGKTSFINKATGAGLEVGDGGDSCTKKVQTGFTTIDNKKILLIDTPGFDDSDGEDAEIFLTICQWLAESTNQKRYLNGAILITPISTHRVTESEQKRVELFKKITGSEFNSQVAFVSSMWDVIAEPTAQRIESNKVEHEVYRDITSTRANVMKFRNTVDSAVEIVRHFIQGRHFRPRQLLLQKELQNAGGLLKETTAFKHLDAMMSKKLDSIQLQINQGIGVTQELKRRVESLSKWRTKLQDWVIKIVGVVLSNTIVGTGISLLFQEM